MKGSLFNFDKGMAYASLATPLGRVFLAADAEGLCGLWFTEQELWPPDIPVIRDAGACGDNKILAQTRLWLDIYFSGQKPESAPAIHLVGTPFQLLVWELLMEIPYGKTETYGALAKKVAARLNVPGMSAQAIGGAVGRNPVGIIVPCHRVLGAGGKLTGYAAGLDKKSGLLALEGVDTGRFN